MALHSVAGRKQEERTGSGMLAAMLCFSPWTSQHRLVSSVCSVSVCWPCLQHFLFYFEVCDPRLPVKFPHLWTACCVSFMCSNCVSISPLTNVHKLCFPSALDRVVALSWATMTRFVSCVWARFLEICTLAWLFDLLVVEPSDCLIVLPLSCWQDIFVVSPLRQRCLLRNCMCVCVCVLLFPYVHFVPLYFPESLMSSLIMPFLAMLKKRISDFAFVSK